MDDRVRLADPPPSRGRGSRHDGHGRHLEAKSVDDALEMLDLLMSAELVGRARTASDKDKARNTLAADPEATAATLAELKTEVQASLADVRRLVYDLRPPALDQLGLVPALQQYAARLTERGTLDIWCPPRPCRHCRPRSRSLPTGSPPKPSPTPRGTLAPGTLRCHSPSPTRSCGSRSPTTESAAPRRDSRGTGLGLAAMAERAAELGGACSAAARDPGTSVVAVLPLAVAS